MQFKAKDDNMYGCFLGEKKGSIKNDLGTIITFDVENTKALEDEWEEIIKYNYHQDATTLHPEVYFDISIKLTDEEISWGYRIDNEDLNECVCDEEGNDLDLDNLDFKESVNKALQGSVETCKEAYDIIKEYYNSDENGVSFN